MTDFFQRHYQSGDLQALVPAPYQRAEYEASLRSNWSVSGPPGRVWSFIEAGQIVAIAGLFCPPDRPHLYEAWSLLGRPSRSGWARLLCYARHEIEALGAVRVEAMARLDIRGAAAALERIGFVREGVHPMGGPGGSTVASYAIVRKGEGDARINL